MKIACPKCGREYRLDPSRIPAKGARFTCWGCQAKVEVRPMQAGQSEAQASVTTLPNKDAKESPEQKPAVAGASASIGNAAAAVKEPAQSNLKNEPIDNQGFVTGPGISKASFMPEAKAVEAKAAEPAKTESTNPEPPAKPAGTAQLDSVVVPENPNRPDSIKTDQFKRTTGPLSPGATGQLKATPLKITCPKCHHEYRIDPSRIPSGGGKFTCRSCQARIEVRPNKQDEKEAAKEAAKDAAKDAGKEVAKETPATPAAKVSAGKYQTPPMPQPTGNTGMSLDLGDSKPVELPGATKEPPPAPLSFDFTKPPSEQEKKVQEGGDVFDGESTMVLGSPPKEVKEAIEAAKKAEKSEPAAPPKDFSFSFGDESAKPPASIDSPWDLNKPVLEENPTIPPALSKPAAEDVKPAAKPVEKSFDFGNPFNLSEPPPPINTSSTLKMSASELASTVEAHSKAKSEATEATEATKDSKKAAEKPKSADKPEFKAPGLDFNFGFGESESTKATAKLPEIPDLLAQLDKPEPTSTEPLISSSPITEKTAKDKDGGSTKPPMPMVSPINESATPTVLAMPAQPASGSPFTGAFDGQETTPLKPFHLETEPIRGGATTDPHERKTLETPGLDPQQHKKTLEAPAVEEEKEKKPAYSFDLGTFADSDPGKTTETAKVDANPFGLSAKPSKVGADNPFEMKTELTPPPTFPSSSPSEPASAESKSATSSIKPATTENINDPLQTVKAEASSFRDLLDKPIAGPAKESDKTAKGDKKAEASLPPPPADIFKPKAKPEKIETEDKASAAAATSTTKASTPAPPKQEAKPEATPPAAKPLPKPDLLNKPLKEEAPLPEYREDQLPTPVYNPDIFNVPPKAKASSSGWKTGAVLGTVAALVVVATLIGVYFMSKNGTQTAQNSPPPVPSPTASVKATPPPSPSPSPTATAKASPTPEPTTKPTTKPTPSPEPTKTPKPEVTVKPSPTPTPKASPTPEPVKPTNPVATNPPAGNGKFTIQLGATPSQGEAEQLSKRLRGAGVEVYVVRADLGAKGIWYRVRTGRYQNSGEAQKAASALKSKGLISEFIVAAYQQ